MRAQCSAPYMYLVLYAGVVLERRQHSVMDRHEQRRLVDLVEEARQMELLANTR